MTPLLLVSLAVLLAVGAPGRLVRAGWAYRSPGLGVLAWQATALTMLTSVAAAALILVMPWHPARSAVSGLWQMCLDALTGAHGGLAQVVAWTGLTLLAAGLARITVAGLAIARAARRRRGHAALARLIGHHRPDLDATVVDRPDPAVYLVPGRCGEVVVTTAALDRLGADELAAALAHERAHARGHHHRSLAFAALLHRAFPAVRLFGLAHRQIGRLVEMCADDQACREHSRLALARALAALATPRSPAGALSAGGGDALERMHRLLSPPTPLPWRVRAAAVTVLVALPAAPLAVVLATAMVPVLHLGLPMG